MVGRIRVGRAIGDRLNGGHLEYRLEPAARISSGHGDHENQEKDRFDRRTSLTGERGRCLIRNFGDHVGDGFDRSRCGAGLLASITTCAGSS